jgi:hypothetical protein
VSGQPAEDISQLIRSSRGELAEASRARPGPERTFLPFAAAAALVVAVDKPRTLRNSQPLHGRGILRGRGNLFLEAHLGDQRAVDPVHSRIDCCKLNTQAF